MAYTENDFEFSYTENDMIDLTEGLKKRSPHKFSEAPPLTLEQQITDSYLSSLDVEQVSREFKKTMKEVLDILSDVGII